MIQGLREDEIDAAISAGILAYNRKNLEHQIFRPAEVAKEIRAALAPKLRVAIEAAAQAQLYNRAGQVGVSPIVEADATLRAAGIDRQPTRIPAGERTGLGLTTHDQGSPAADLARSVEAIMTGDPNADEVVARALEELGPS